MEDCCPGCLIHYNSLTGPMLKSCLTTKKPQQPPIARPFFRRESVFPDRFLMETLNGNVFPTVSQPERAPSISPPNSPYNSPEKGRQYMQPIARPSTTVKRPEEFVIETSAFRFVFYESERTEAPRMSAPNSPVPSPVEEQHPRWDIPSRPPCVHHIPL